MPDYQDIHGRRKLQSGPLLFEPRNEQGVVALFGAICEAELGLRIGDIQPGYPDCVAIDRRGRRVRIEFEFASSRFDHERHRRTIRDCDLIVCWIDNAAPNVYWRGHVKVRELAPLFPELGANVWVQPFKPMSADRLTEKAKLFSDWTVPAQARKGDLLLLYRSGSSAALTSILQLTSNAQYSDEHDWGRGYAADLRRLIVLPESVSRESLMRDSRTRKISFFRSPTPMGQSVLPDWEAVLEVLMEFNPRAGVKKALTDIAVSPAPSN